MNSEPFPQTTRDIEDLKQQEQDLFPSHDINFNNHINNIAHKQRAVSLHLVNLKLKLQEHLKFLRSNFSAENIDRITVIENFLRKQKIL